MRRFLLTMNFISPFCRHFSSFLRMSKIVSIHRFCQNCTKDFFIQFLDFPLAACPLTHKGQKTQICENWQQKMCLVGQPMQPQRPIHFICHRQKNVVQRVEWWMELSMICRQLENFPSNGLRIGLYRGIAFKVVEGRAEHARDWMKKLDNAHGICWSIKALKNTLKVFLWIYKSLKMAVVKKKVLLSNLIGLRLVLSVHPTCWLGKDINFSGKLIFRSSALVATDQTGAPNPQTNCFY